MKKNRFTILGVMSGTSLDGLDLALCHFTKERERWRYRVLKAETIPYPEEIQRDLRESFHYPAAELAALNMRYARLLASQINNFLEKETVKPDYIASHGHTVFHQPSRGFTTQIGSGAVIAALTGIPTLSDFRATDLSLGGQGAPLVPIGDALLFGEYQACLNLGGFANISYPSENGRIAYDISPCNLILNRLASEIGKEFDEGGHIAAQSSPDKQLIAQLNQWDYYSKQAPKSLGYEDLKDYFFPVLEESKIPINRKISSVTEHIAIQISSAMRAVPAGKILVTGGGAHNRFLMERMQSLTDKILVVPPAEIVNFKEAIIFAFLGVLRLRGEINCLASVTGASRDSCGGALYYP